MRIQLSAVLGVFIACGLADHSENAAPTSVFVAGGARDWQGQVPSAASTEAWRTNPSEETALALATEYFGELFGERSYPIDAFSGLSVTLPSSALQPMELSTRGMTVRVSRISGSNDSASKRGDETFYGSRHFFAPVGTLRTIGGALQTLRLEEYEIVEAGTEYRTRYVLDLPPGMRGVRATSDYLELGDERGGDPLLRMHYPQVRDARGSARTGVIQLKGVANGSQPNRVVAPSQLVAELIVDLRGLQGPLVVDPGWSSTAAMGTARQAHTTTMLADGRLLAAGGRVGALNLKSAELYNEATNTWTATTGELANARLKHLAKLLANGRVLIAGGNTGAGVTSSSELYDPSSDTFLTISVMERARTDAAAVLLPDGRVLVTGGEDATGAKLRSTEVFDPNAATADSTWLLSGDLTTFRALHTATLLPSGRVLVAGGMGTTGLPISSAEVFDPATGTASLTTGFSARADHAATRLPNGEVIVVGGRGASGTFVATGQKYDEGTNSWTSIASMASTRVLHSATVLPSGKVLVTGGVAAPSSELYDPQTNSWTNAGTIGADRTSHTATLLRSGSVLIAGGFDGTDATAITQRYDPDSATLSAATSMSSARYQHTTTLLPDGRVLVAGGVGAGSTILSSAAILDPATNTWTAAPAMSSGRSGHTATLLPSGIVLVAGGRDASGSPTATAELFNPATNQWSSLFLPMNTARAFHTATLLASGKVLVAGGQGALTSAELFDPSVNTWTSVGGLTTGRAVHCATLLPNGKVLLTGGRDGPNGASYFSSAELFDPSSGAENFTASFATMTSARAHHAAVILPSGKVMVIGGAAAGNNAISSVDIYDPALNSFVAGPPLPQPRSRHTATALPNGKVLIAGGENNSGFSVTTTDLYAHGVFTAGPSSTVSRALHTATLLPNARVLLIGGTTSGAANNSVQLFESSGHAAWRATLDGPGTVHTGLNVVGSGFRSGSSAGSGGRSDSSTDLPVLLLQAIDTGAFRNVNYSSLTDTSISGSFSSFPDDGRHILWIGINGVFNGRIVRKGNTNSAPTANPASFVATEDTPLSITLSGTDPDLDALSFVSISTPGKGSLSGTAPNLIYTPLLNAVGSDSFTFKVSDGTTQSTAAATVDFNIGAVNDPPVFNPLPDIAIDEDQNTSVALSGVGPGGGADEAGQLLTFTTSSSAPAIVPADVVTGAPPNGTMQLFPVANATGFADLTVTLTDDSGATFVDTFRVTVNPINDAPTFDPISPVTIDEDGLANPITLTGIGPGGGTDEASGQTLTLTVASTNPGLFSNLSISGSGNTRTLNWTPAQHANGTAQVTVTATDTGSNVSPNVNTTQRSFQITINPLNDAPTVSQPQLSTLNEDPGTQTVPLSGLSPGGGIDEQSQVLTVTASSDNPTLIQNLAVTGSGTNRSVTFTPAANSSGNANITVTITDNGGPSPGNTTTTTFEVRVSSVNDDPSFDAIASQTLTEDQTGATATVTGVSPGGGTDESSQTVTLTATSDNPSLLPNPTVSGTGASRTLTFSPSPNAHGTATITVVATDDGAPARQSAPWSFVVTIQSVNDAPTFDAIADVSVNEDPQGGVSVSITGVGPGAGAQESSQQLTWAVSSTNSTLTPSPQVTGTGATATLGFAPPANANGTATLTVTLTDNGTAAEGGAKALSRTFTVTINSVNDAPTVNDITTPPINEDAAAQSLQITGIGPGGGSDEASQTVTVTASSDNPTLITNLVVSGTGATRTLSYTPAPNGNGTATVTLTVTDDGTGTNSATDAITITVQAVNDAPVLNALAALNVAEDAAAQTVSLAGLGTGGGSDEASQTLTVTAISSDPSVVANPTVNGTGTSRSLSVAPQSNANGSATITVTVKDNGNITNGGVDTFTRSFVVTVSAVNDAPTLTAPSPVTLLEDAAQQTVTLAGRGPGGGADEAAQTVTITASSSDPALIPTPVISGNSLTFTPAADQAGSATITLLVSDSGGTGNGGVDSTTVTFVVSVTAVNDAPTLAGVDPLTLAEDAAAQTLTLTGIGPGGGADEAPQTITVTAQATNAALVPDLAVTGAGATRSLTFTPPANTGGMTTITVTVTDNGSSVAPNVNTFTRTFTVTVTAVNDAPVFDEIDPRTVLKDSGSSQAVVTGIGPGGGTDEASQTVTLTATSSNPAIVPNPNITGSGSSRVMTYRPAAGAVGTVTITVEARDSGGTAGGGVDTFSRTFDITVEKLANQTPVAQSGSVTSDGSPVALTLKGTDLDSDTLTFVIVDPPAHGELSGTAPNLTYTPEAGFNGVDSFTFKVNDGTTDSDAATFSITVNGGTGSEEKRSHYGWSLGCSLAPEGAAPWLVLAALAALRTLGRRKRAAAAALIGLLVLAFAPLANAQDASKRPKLAFLGVSAGAGVAVETAASVSGYVQSELISLDAYDVIGTSEISAMIGFERQKQLLGCSEDSNSCLAEMAGALDTDRAISGDLSQVGETTLLNISLIDVRTSKSLSRVGRRVDAKASSEAVLDAGRAAVLELLGFDPALKGKTLSFPRGFGGLFVAARGEADLAGGSVSPGVMAELSGKRFGGAVSVLVGPSTGFRGEARFYPVELGPVRPYLAAGGTVFAPAVGLRGAVGAAVRFGQVHVFSDAAYEHFVNDSSNFYSDAILVSLGAGWLF